ncbi:hypothetical protein ACHAXA_000715 [Cyclostephanos tholiformis]|uniref:G-protein coupled receptors family 2 profile 2 domain-containing protein n=1 Tax=Cyclostephanos tholiformis TaxID=382380 RepID=A0ABD3RRH4_9STRA
MNFPKRWHCCRSSPAPCRSSGPPTSSRTSSFGGGPIRRVYHRLVLGLSCAELIASFVFVLSTWPIPETQGAYLASGNTRTCTAQGFLNELGNMAAPLYNMSLCAYYVLVVRMGWIEERIRSNAEPYMHAMPIAISSIISITGLPFEIYNDAGFLCWMAAYPTGCQSDDACTRGIRANVFRWVHSGIIWSAIFLIALGMYSIYRKVREEERMQSRDDDGAEDSRGRKSRQVAKQALLFVGALYLTWIFTTISRIYNILTGKQSFLLQVLMAIFFPLQGFFNCLIYLRPRYLRS